MSEDLGLFVHTFNDNNKYCFPSSQNLRQRIQMQIFEKLKPFSEFFLLHFSNFHQVSNNLRTKITLIVYVFPNYKLQKTSLNKCLKSLVSKYCWTVNMLNGSKHCWNLHNSTFIIFFYHAKGLGVAKFAS